MKEELFEKLGKTFFLPDEIFQDFVYFNRKGFFVTLGEASSGLRHNHLPS
jgi:hypothetical protein